MSRAALFCQHAQIAAMLQRLFVTLLISIALCDAHAKPNVAPTVSLSILESDAVFAAPGSITLVAAAQDSDGTIAKVAFYSGSTLLATRVPGSGPLNFVWTNVPVGTYTLTTVATDNKGASTTSAARTVTVATNVAPTISITSPLNNAQVTQPDVVALRVDASDAVGHVTQVSYVTAGAVIFTSNASPWAFNWSNAPVGSHTIMAQATDDKGASTVSGPVTVVVKSNVPENVAPSVSMTATPTVATAPGTVALSASASDSDGTVAKVEFFSGTDLLAAVTQAPYSYTWTNVEAGSYSLTARATDNLGATATTQPSTVTIAAGAAQLYFVYADQVNTAREITNGAGTVVWRADVAEPFGANMPNENPSNVGTFTYNQRFPGQYFDKETGLHYNYFRDYDPAFGRYIQSDPIGLRGGINTYTYGDASPIRKIDQYGLATYMCTKPLAGLGAKWGPRMYPESSWNPSPTYHQFICVKDASGTITCGGQDRSGSAAWSPGQPTNDAWPKDGNGSCKKEDDRECVDQCVLEKILSPNRPRYGIGPQGTDCQEWADEVVEKCQKSCRGKK